MIRRSQGKSKLHKRPAEPDAKATSVALECFGAIFDFGLSAGERGRMDTAGYLRIGFYISTFADRREEAPDRFPHPDKSKNRL